jgi:hypothetical protein
MKKFGRKCFADFADSRGYCYTMIRLAKTTASPGCKRRTRVSKEASCKELLIFRKISWALNMTNRYAEKGGRSNSCLRHKSQKLRL